MDYPISRASMMRVARAFVRTAEDAEDVVQETWLAILKGLKRFQGRSSFNTWAYRILVNRARSHARRQSRTLPFSQTSVDIDAIAGVGANPEQQYLRGEMRSKIDDAIAALPPQQKHVIYLRDVEGWSADEVSMKLGLSSGNQRVLLHRARTDVRRRLQAYMA